MTLSPPLTSQSDPPLPPWESLPTMYDLPSENPEEPGLPDDFHFLQPLLLYLTFQPINWLPELVYSAADLNLYYDLEHPLWYKRPDWFGVVGVSRLYKGEDLRLSYVTWQETANPFVVVELLSPGTEDEDLGNKQSQKDKPSTNKPPTKWEVYERILRIPYYIVFSRYTNELHAFHLVGGHYEPMNLIDGLLPMPELGLSLGLWSGSFRGISKLWLRWFTLDGELIPEPTEEATVAAEEAANAKEEAAAAKERAIVAEQEATQAKRKAEILAQRLRQLGVNPDELDD
ncbi:Uma2 family endonuclease [Sphaerospermopsis torques-reginae]|uniref:Uma2 family endonuclease n=1 Tax=Sphaerospermopsis torques-reginae ITEP-024 TaxID=984208 RepID=A0ABX8WYW5_9CYAN|nr:Uma2 family endonuclease [Sphaerospermopsis torques-reginae]QYX31563.1 Uma2 family endonuclease [Sphaerospermopsis torques-reginae ITEP-024]